MHGVWMTCWAPVGVMDSDLVNSITQGSLKPWIKAGWGSFGPHLILHAQRIGDDLAEISWTMGYKSGSVCLTLKFVVLIEAPEKYDHNGEKIDDVVAVFPEEEGGVVTFRPLRVDVIKDDYLCMRQEVIGDRAYTLVRQTA